MTTCEIGGEPLSGTLDLNLRVADLEASIAWYARIFGIEPIYRGVDRSLSGGSVAMACFRIGGVKVWLLSAAQACSGEQRVGMAFMTRRPLAELREELAARGALFDDREVPGFPADPQGVRVGRDAEFLYILDPDGHRIEFCRTFRNGGTA